MKRILAVLLILCVAVTMFVACGEKKEEPTTDTTTTTTETTTETTEKPADTTTPVETAPSFENAVLSVTLPVGWTATEDTGAVMITKADSADFISVLPIPSNNAPIEEYLKVMAPGATIEDATIGANNFKKYVTSGITATNLVADKGANFIAITVQNFEGTDEQAILSSIILK